MQYTSCSSIADGPEALLVRSACMALNLIADNYKSFSNCPHRCTEILIDNEYYETDWPSISNQLSFYETVIKSKPYAHKFSAYEEILQYAKQGNVSQAERLLKETDLMRNNFIKFTYMFRPNKLSMLADVKQITITDLVSSLGGVLNLYCGISLLVIVEFIDVLVNCFCYCFITKPKNSCKSRSMAIDVAEIQQNK